MSYSVDNIIPYSLSISPAGLGYANFAQAVVFIASEDVPGTWSPGDYKDYSTTSEVAADFPSTTETYAVCAKWLGGIPAQRQIRVYAGDDVYASIDWAINLDAARDKFWWFMTFFTETGYSDVANMVSVAGWCNTNQIYFVNCQTGTNVAAIRDPNDSTDISSQITTLGYRFCNTFGHATDPLAGIALAKWYSSVNYDVANSTITGEYKILDGVASEDLSTTEYNAMKAKKCVFCTTIDLQGSTVTSRAVNTVTHSSYGEFIDDVINLSAFLNRMQADISGVVMNQPKKLAQTPPGQASILGASKIVAQQYVSNGYLGPRNYIDPDDGVYKYVPGYQILTKPEDILDLSEANRNARKAEPVKMRIFRAGAIHIAELDISVY